MEYRTRYVPDHPNASASGCVPVHVLVAEKALGRFFREDEQVHHADGNKRNNANSNLVICQDMAYHKLLHVRADVLRAGGDPNTQRQCDRCRQLKTFSEFNRLRKNKSDGLQRYCRRCQSEYCRTYKRREAA